MSLSKALSVCSLLLLISINSVLSQNATTCVETSSCGGQTVVTKTVSCEGSYSCENALITQATTTYGFGYYSNAGGYITTETMQAYGYYCLANATLQVGTLQAFGYYSAYYAEIYSNDASNNELTVNLDGLFSGVETNIHCEEGDECSVNCGSSRGCYSTTFYCYSGATCYYNCDDDPDYCPQLVGGIGSQIYSVSNDETNEEMARQDAIASAASGKSNLKLATIPNNANSELLRKSGLNGRSKVGLTDSEMNVILEERNNLRKSKFEREMVTGVVDEELIEKTIDYFKERGESMPYDLERQLVHRGVASISGPISHGASSSSLRSHSMVSRWAMTGKNANVSSEFKTYFYAAFYGLCGALTLLVIQTIHKKCRDDGAKNTMGDDFGRFEYQAVL